MSDATTALAMWRGIVANLEASTGIEIDAAQGGLAMLERERTGLVMSRMDEVEAAEFRALLDRGRAALMRWLEN